MDSSLKVQTRHVETEEPDILQALREALIAGQRDKKLAVRDGSSDEPARSDPEELGDARPTARPDASSQEELHNVPTIGDKGESAWAEDDYVPLAGIASNQEELHDALNIAGEGDSMGEELNDGSRLVTGEPAEAMGEELRDAPSISAEPPIDSTLRHGAFRDAKLPIESSPDPAQVPSVLYSRPHSSGDRLFTRATFRIITRSIVLIAAVSVAFALLPTPSGERTRQETAIAPSDIAPAVAAVAPAVSTRQSNQPEATLSQLSALRRQVEELAAKQGDMTRQDQLKTMASDVAALRRGLERLTVKQDEMAGEITQLEAVEKSRNKKIGVHTRSYRK
jgi:hypothetical protein